MDFSSFLSSSSSKKPDWAWLPDYPLFLILSQLYLLTDIFSFSRVCSSWHSVSKERLKEQKNQINSFFIRRLPMLLVPSSDNDERRLNLYCVSDGLIGDLQVPVPENTRCIGSSHGWLILFNKTSYNITLFNPFYFGQQRGEIRLPQLFKLGPRLEILRTQGQYFPEYFIYKAILSANPISSPDNYTVMLLYSEDRKLAFWKSGDECWTRYHGKYPKFFDIIYRQGRFLSVNHLGVVCGCDTGNDGRNPQITAETMINLAPLGYSTNRYLVETNDGNTLFQVIRLSSTVRHNEPLFKTVRFLLYKLEVLEDLPQWVPVSNIDEGAMFLGENHSLYVRATDFPGVIPNSIYYTDDYLDERTVYIKPYQVTGPCDIGVYHMKDSSIHQHYCPSPSQKHLPPPIWILPTM